MTDRADEVVKYRAAAVADMTIAGAIIMINT